MYCVLGMCIVMKGKVYFYEGEGAIKSLVQVHYCWLYCWPTLMRAQYIEYTVHTSPGIQGCHQLFICIDAWPQIFLIGISSRFETDIDALSMPFQHPIIVSLMPNYGYVGF